MEEKVRKLEELQSYMNELLDHLSQDDCEETLYAAELKIGVNNKVVRLPVLAELWGVFEDVIKDIKELIEEEYM